MKTNNHISTRFERVVNLRKDILIICLSVTCIVLAIMTIIMAIDSSKMKNEIAGLNERIEAFKDRNLPDENDPPVIIAKDTPTPTSAPTDGPGVPDVTDEPKPTAAEEPTAGPTPTEEPGNVTVQREKPVGMLDPGHGAIGSDDSGVAYYGVHEGVANLKIAKRVYEVLTEAGIDVIMTHDEKSFLTIRERQELSDASDIDAFVSIHLNAYPEDTSVSGTEVWYNSATNANSESLAYYVLEHLLDELDFRNRGAIDDSDNYNNGGGLRVLKTTKPAILIECGFMTNKPEFDYILSDEGIEGIANGILDGLIDYLEDMGWEI